MEPSSKPQSDPQTLIAGLAAKAGANQTRADQILAAADQTINLAKATINKLNESGRQMESLQADAVAQVDRAMVKMADDLAGVPDLGEEE